MNIEKLLLSYCHPFLVGCTRLGFGEDLEHMSSPTPPCSGTSVWPFPCPGLSASKSCVSYMKISPLCRQKQGLRPVDLIRILS